MTKLGLLFWSTALFPSGLDAAASGVVADCRSRAGMAASAFIENRGQWPDEVRYSRSVGDLMVWVDERGFTLQTEHEADRGVRQGVALGLRFEEASAEATLEGVAPRPGRYHYFRGRDPSRWATGARSFGRVRYSGLYPGIDIDLLVVDGRLEYDLVLEPGADVESVVVRWEGAETTRRLADGSLVLSTPMGELRQRPPKAWVVDAAGRREAVPCRIERLGEGRYGFRAPGGVTAAPTVVDPGLEWSTYLGGSISAPPPRRFRWTTWNRWRSTTRGS